MGDKEIFLHSAILDAAGVCIADGAFPLRAVGAFSVTENGGVYETDFAIVAEDAFSMSRSEIAELICENLSSAELKISSVSHSDGIIRITAE